MAEGAEGRFVTGSTMRHVAVMTATGSIGLSFMFLVDFATLFYVSLLGDETLTAGVGFAWAVQFFTVSVGIGLSIAAMALVSRSIGARERERARGQATAALLISGAVLTITALLILLLRRPILDLIGAEGEAAEVAARFLLISVPSLPLVGLGMVAASTLRAEGAARKAMMVTVSSGTAALILDPLLIFGLGLGVDGAAFAMVLSRGMAALVGLRFCLGLSLLGPASLWRARAVAPAFFAIAGPAILTQLSTPLGNILMTWWISSWGDSAVAGWAVASRLTVLAFGGIFALSGAIGGIIGQNYGARRADRVASAYRDSLIFAAGYVVSVWALLALFAPLIVRGFGVAETGASVVYAFCFVGAGGFMFNGALFVANAAFNNLGRPLLSTAFNWARDAGVTPLMLLAAPASLGAPGVVYAQAGAGVLVGSVAVLAGWRLTRNVAFGAPPAAAPAPPAGGATAKGAGAILHAADGAAGSTGAAARHDLETDAGTSR
jgi:putative MATE family efflux protein